MPGPAIAAIELPTTTVIAIAVGGLLVIGLLIALLRGNFSTPQRRAEIALLEGISGADIPKRTLAKGAANSLGHSADSSQLRGMGVLWLSDQALGFVLRKPMRQFQVSLRDVNAVQASSEFSRIGMSQRSDDVDFLVVTWTDTSGQATIGFRVDDAPGWAEKVQHAIAERRKAR